ncbi:short-chain dehydrogenase/reductase SDR [Novosphingobium aromaticivorans DSM 12444]|uniref:Short-chain dehydrogenase/reductase SDR n=1 Tax=Novosphingobium aromaticivorans (strain ATCC 700278 / DSM 12444 / CCUG 56034 / CIP 105152 / NBRC 16084 / F199) TaxID=279238 RepID=Q2G758_NOVAD|nr:SDR family NAD(P)-dependent oxidoreductase [Novosphingobium aromaticivorans]ABD26315.1 short-chain dehydrogenase/reductase SDR [Novosphingobium aromaticivorans DSM 12444]SCY54796.1 NADP-dependent 3-hydroxy acid dehydrogenase YdfG [Novosphingobium aromaticivorans]
MGIETFAGRTAFVTGGASGIGLGIVKALARRDAFVVIADMRTDHISRALKALASAGLGESVAAVELDVTDRAAYASMARRMDEEFGGIDVLVNNAGVGVEGPILQATYPDWDFGLGVNLGGVVNGLQAMLPQMIAHGRGGHVVNTASLAATVVMPGHLAIYAAGKAAVLNLTENMRADLAGRGIGSSVLCPGFVRSNIHEAARNRPAHLREGSGFAASEQALSMRETGSEWMDPDAVGEMVADAILADQLYVITHGEFANRMRERAEALLAATPVCEMQF